MVSLLFFFLCILHYYLFRYFLFPRSSLPPFLSFGYFATLASPLMLFPRFLLVFRRKRGWLTDCLLNSDPVEVWGWRWRWLMIVLLLYFMRTSRLEEETIRDDEMRWGHHPRSHRHIRKGLIIMMIFRRNEILFSSHSFLHNWMICFCCIYFPLFFDPVRLISLVPLRMSRKRVREGQLEDGRT